MTLGVSSSRWKPRPRAVIGVGLALVLALLGPQWGVAEAQTSSNIGGGQAEGSITFAAPGLAPLFAPCGAVDFTLDGDTRATVVINVATEGGGGAVDGFAGMVQLDGSGHGFCENTSSGGGSLTVTVPEATAPNGSTFGCDLLRGGYTRVGADVEAILGGECAVNSNPVPVMFVFRGEFTPTGGSGLSQPGLSEPVMTADFSGTFAVMPA